jgi:tetratricopeptide (TPR) repeat protein
VESVAWVSERKDVLCGFFYLLSLLAYCGLLGAVGPGESSASRGKRYAAVLLLFVCALLSKPMAVSLPVVLVLMDWVPGGRIGNARALGRVLLEKAPFVLFIVLSALFTYSAQSSGGAVVAIAEVPISSRVALAADALVTYLRELLWPVGLTPFNAAAEEVSLVSTGPLLSMSVVCALSAVALLALPRRRWPAALWAYYCVTLLPVLGLVKVGLQATADRYTYLPSLGPTFLAGLAIAKGFQRAAGAPRHRRRWLAAAVASSLVVLTTLAALTVGQIGIWRNSASLWTCAIDSFPRSGEGVGRHQGVFLGVLYRNRGIAHADRGEYDLAILDLDNAIALYPGNADFLASRGVINLRLGRLEQALADLDRALVLTPDTATTLANRGTVLRAMGHNGRALEDFTRAIALEPGNVKLYSDRAELFYRLGLLQKAVEDLDAAIRLTPQAPELYYNRAHLHRRLSEEGPASLDLRRACELGLKMACAVPP